MGNTENTEVLVLKKGKDCFNKKDYIKAEILFKEVLQLTPNDSQAQFELEKYHI